LKYEGTVYLGAVGSEIENGECRDSVDAITMRAGDEFHGVIRATKGYEARQTHLNRFMAGKCDFILLLDSDMIFPNDTLEKLRSHGLPFVSGLYLRRRFDPLCPVWFEQGASGEMPMRIFTRIPEPNTLYKLGASGWGCILIHRDVITATREILKGEPEIIEDSMEVYPYDLAKVLRGEEKIKPLRGKKDTVGSDIRFPFFARLAGFELYGDSGVRCQHMLNYPLDVRDYEIGMTTEHLAALNKNIDAEFEEERADIARRLAELQ
jgi:hypothetical protein